MIKVKLHEQKGPQKIFRFFYVWKNQLTYIVWSTLSWMVTGRHDAVGWKWCTYMVLNIFQHMFVTYSNILAAEWLWKTHVYSGFVTFLDIRIKLFLTFTGKDQPGYGLIQWGTTLHYNVIPHLTESISRPTRKTKALSCCLTINVMIIVCHQYSVTRLSGTSAH